MHGYVAYIVRYDDGFKTTLFEHRLVMEQHLGRALRSDEVVHHIDGDKTNNAAENLELTTPSKHASKHARPAPIVDLTCLVCERSFVRLARKEQERIRRRKRGPYCGKKCAGVGSRKHRGRKRDSKGRIRCSDCKLFLPEAEFCRERGRPGGLSYRCRSCKAAQFQYRKNKQASVAE